MSSISTSNYDTASIQVFRNTRAQLLQSETSRNFVTVVVILLIVIWTVRFLSRWRTIYDLQRAVDARRAVRIDGIHCPQNLSIQDISGLVRAQTTHSLHSVRTLNVGAHSRSVQLIKGGDRQLTLEALVQTTASALVFVHIGPLDSAVRRLIASHMKRRIQLIKEFSQQKRSKAAVSPLRESAVEQLRSGADLFTAKLSSSSKGPHGDQTSESLHMWQHHLMNQAEVAQTLLDFRSSECTWSSTPTWLSPNTSQNIRIPLDAEALTTQLSTADDAFPLLLIVVSFPPPPESEPESQDDNDKVENVDEPLIEDASWTTDSRTLQVRQRRRAARERRRMRQQLIRKRSAQLHAAFCAEVSCVHVQQSTQPPHSPKSILSSSSRLAVDVSRISSARIERQLLFAGDAVCLDELDVYGIDDPDDAECQVCLSNPKNIVLLPCRHCCICHECFERLDKCPQCRAPISAHLTFVQPECELDDDEATVESPSQSSPQSLPPVISQPVSFVSPSAPLAPLAPLPPVLPASFASDMSGSVQLHHRAGALPPLGPLHSMMLPPSLRSRDLSAAAAAASAAAGRRVPQ